MYHECEMPSVTWQKKLAQGFTSVEQLLDHLKLPQTLASQGAQQQFKTRVPQGFVARMQVGNPRDPLLLQVLASTAELEASENYSIDPLQEIAASPLQGLIHKYKGRVLLTLTGVCAINCRYCFRRHFPYQDHNPGRSGWQQVMSYIHADPSIHEVILSGGDPLLATDATLEQLILALETIPHVRTLRIHSRIPVVLPERIDKHFLQLLAKTTLHKIMVLHSNHAQELDAQVQEVCLALRDSNCHLLNQSVLLKGINDDALILAALSERLFDCSVLPYYLHLLDKVVGAAHFDIDFMQAQIIYQQLQTLLPGYLVPRLVREEAGKKHKTLLVS